MKKRLVVSLFIICFAMIAAETSAQCSICTKTAMQLGVKPAQGMNSGVLYLMFTPFAVIGYVGYRWWKSGNNVKGNS